MVCDGNGIKKVPNVTMKEDLLSDEAESARITVTVDTQRAVAAFAINGVSVTTAPVPVPRQYITEASYPFVVLNTVGDTVEWGSGENGIKGGGQMSSM